MPLVLHGFERPGDGELRGSCFGVGYAPYEASPKACEDFAVHLSRLIARREESLRALRAGEVDKLPAPVRTRKVEWITPEDARFPKALRLAIAQAEADLRVLKSYRTDALGRVQAWSLRALPDGTMPEERLLPRESVPEAPAQGSSRRTR
jgi:hypothetical protein